MEADAGWAAYQEKTDRIIPVVALHRLAQGGPGNISATSFAEAIKVVHDAFRRELALTRLREEHERIAELVEVLRKTLTSTPDLTTVRTEVDRPTTELEAHPAYEEDELTPLLDAAPQPTGPASVESSSSYANARAR